ncbi:AarF/ABC1/UbiB kinase family protein [Nostoc sp. CENA67]|uniref:AarF/ABC1/UbiB kinase family protein n=1 Tax=Amazonocrinis nigriterrae CENA67 TaxID=2794033 RepID=A0A8J7HS79_9NOST|nr:AarF/ABC1/UbiB kinase family protein [Amazonocrinis nigriterrae]MBH8561389.1 AarF/ABC1/UbiB kinase family protein [Amazonocrinis nigriterrae CENA67]
MKARSIPLQNNVAINLSYYKKQPGKLWARRLTILKSFLSFSILLAWDWLTRRLLQNQRLRASILRQKLIELGPTFIKLGQFLSCRPDIIPTIYLDELANLQDKLPPFPNQQAYQIIEEELGYPHDQIYAELIPEPVAAASLGQVYKGKLQTGEIVAVKIQRPGIIEQITLDIYLLRQLAAWAQKNISLIHSDLVALSDELATRLFAEMDYVQEAFNAEKFAQLYGKLEQIHVPRIYFQYTSHRVLTMEWVNGIKLTSTEAIRAQGLEPADFVGVGFKCSLRQLLQGGFFHADPHPGNVLVTSDGKLAYLDFGMMSEVPPEVCDLLIISLLHMITGDFAALAEDYILLEFLPPETDLTYLVPKLAEIFGNIREASVAEFGFKQSFSKLFDLIYEYSWQTPTYYVMIFRCFATLEGVALKVNPDFQVYKVGYPYVTEWLLTKRSPVLWDALKSFWLSNQTIEWEQVSDVLENIYQSDDFNLNYTLELLLEFLYSPQGNSLRSALVNEIATNIESLSQETFDDVMAWSRSIITPFPTTTKLNSTLQNMQEVINKVLVTKPLNLNSFYELSQVFVRPEAQRLGQEIISELGRRMLMRFMPK